MEFKGISGKVYNARWVLGINRNIMEFKEEAQKRFRQGKTELIET